MGRAIKPSEVSSFFNQRAADFISGSPSKWLSLTFKKFVVFWNGYEISNNQNAYFYRQFASITHLLPPLFWIISPLSLLGLFSVWRFGEKYTIIAIFIAVYMLTVIVFFVNGRFRLPVWPMLIILAGLAIDYIIKLAKEKSYRRLIILILIFFLLLVVTISIFMEFLKNRLPCRIFPSAMFICEKDYMTRLCWSTSALRNWLRVCPLPI